MRQNISLFILMFFLGIPSYSSSSRVYNGSLGVKTNLPATYGLSANLSSTTIEGLDDAYITIRVFNTNFVKNFENELYQGALIFGRMIQAPAMVYAYLSDIYYRDYDPDLLVEIEGKNHMVAIDKNDIDKYVLCASLKKDGIGGNDKLLAKDCKPIDHFWLTGEQDFLLKLSNGRDYIHLNFAR